MYSCSRVWHPHSTQWFCVQASGNAYFSRTAFGKKWSLLYCRTNLSHGHCFSAPAFSNRNFNSVPTSITWDPGKRKSLFWGHRTNIQPKDSFFCVFEKRFLWVWEPSEWTGIIGERCMNQSGSPGHRVWHWEEPQWWREIPGSCGETSKGGGTVFKAGLPLHTEGPWQTASSPLFVLMG